MGGDFANIHCFIGTEDPLSSRMLVINYIDSILERKGYHRTDTEKAAQRSIVIGPPGRWIFIGDTAGSNETMDMEAFFQLATDLSQFFPTVSVQMSDSATVQFHLYREGRQIDQFGNAAFPFYPFRSPEEAEKYFGQPALWALYLQEPRMTSTLRTTWVHRWEAESILERTASLLGWHPLLAVTGYTYDDEGIGIKYTDYLENPILISACTEMHFALRR